MAFWLPGIWLRYKSSTYFDISPTFNSTSTTHLARLPFVAGAILRPFISLAGRLSSLQVNLHIGSAANPNNRPAQDASQAELCGVWSRRDLDLWKTWVYLLARSIHSFVTKFGIASSFSAYIVFLWFSFLFSFTFLIRPRLITPTTPQPVPSSCGPGPGRGPRRVLPRR